MGWELSFHLLSPVPSAHEDGGRGDVKDRTEMRQEIQFQMFSEANRTLLLSVARNDFGPHLQLRTDSPGAGGVEEAGEV